MKTEVQKRVSKAKDYSKESKAARSTRSRTVRGVPTAVGLFVGGGGFDLGFRQAGYRILAATAVDPFAERPIKRTGQECRSC